MIAATHGKLRNRLRDLFVHRGEAKEVSGEMHRLQCGSLDNCMIK